MKRICFCFQLHIPLILRNYRFFDVGQNHQYFNEAEVAGRIKQVTKNILLPFIEMLGQLHSETTGMFKAGISISGATLQLLQKNAPNTIELLNKLQQNNCIEFLSEPWSHSLLPFTGKNLLAEQIKRHDTCIKEVFGSTPKVFFAYTPNSTLPLLAATVAEQKIGIIAYADSLSNNKAQTNTAIRQPLNEQPGVLIDQTTSQIFGKIDFDPNFHTLASYASATTARIVRNILSRSPLIIVFNPVQRIKPFTLNQVLVWKTVIQQLHNVYNFQYSLPSQIVKQTKFPVSDANSSEKLLQHFQLPDFWLNSKMQREVFARQKALNTLLVPVNNSSLQSTWDTVQDMDNLFFMSNHFLKPSFAARYFSPYTSPYMAYINYMNVLDDIQSRLIKETRNVIPKTNLRRKKKETVSG
ncbi:hypothetical protein OU798_18930 [Prolixibacteraceae bacterium Z1-6]|uniref:Glycoside hydrolase family 57 N-terminal domain-containing protein n=1 Tax=Draconibacterium aestuarii TaxID=2998507 RepID=A0A9X3J8D0_9BACT|nr:hypothetical protein [Prolixibacteraceae bacterium Z1-6]